MTSILVFPVTVAIGIMVMIYGWGIEPNSWWWIGGGGLAQLALLAAAQASQR